ncbi:TetR/AcrR family transcriptional regulator [Salinispirillum marinum]|uniref:TetR/AcrR family transcriptional regulator n=2 Tax=Saccharospirillaceae TaxID=255527 RepID=A0ABV8BHA8_9GAMM
MARASKRDHIVAEATQLFLTQGFKGTSIDLVVSTCAVSKPTVYNHFPDKAVLVAAVIETWLEEHKPSTDISCASEDTLWAYLDQYWWCDQHMAMYRLIIAEGWRFAAAADRFWREFDARWQKVALRALSTHFAYSLTEAQDKVDAIRWRRLLLSMPVNAVSSAVSECD